MWNGEEYERAATLAVAKVGEFVAASQRGEGPVTAWPSLEGVLHDLDARRWIREGGMDPDAFGAFLDAYLARSLRIHHPGYMAHQVAAPDVGAALSDLVHGAINNPMAMWEMGPAAAAIEVAVLDWMLGQVGWDPATAAGVLTHGGSLANLTALLGARARIAPDAWTRGTPSDLCVLAPPSAHYSVARAVAILGLGEDALIALETDSHERVVPERLEAALARARAAGRRPMALVAAACATSTGLHDDLGAIARFCREHGIWLHADCAHGASALLSARHRGLLAGIEHADSTVWDPHKMLATSSMCAAVLFRNAADLGAAFHQEASYLFYGDGHEGIDLMSRAVECTKAPLGTKLFLNLAWRGERGMGDHVAGLYDAAHRFWELIRARPGFDCPYEPESNILCFRYGSDGARQIALRARLLAGGDFHLSSTAIAGERYLRLVVMAPATDDGTIERLMDAIEHGDRDIIDGDGIVASYRHD